MKQRLVNEKGKYSYFIDVKKLARGVLCRDQIVHDTAHL
jgi:hypothetical protein